LNYIKSISTCFGHYYAHQETRKRDWLTLHVELPGCAGSSCMELRCGQCALLESCCSIAVMHGHTYLVLETRDGLFKNVSLALCMRFLRLLIICLLRLEG
jgi:hypothetical protein